MLFGHVFVTDTDKATLLKTPMNCFFPAPSCLLNVLAHVLSINIYITTYALVSFGHVFSTAETGSQSVSSFIVDDFSTSDDDDDDFR